MTRFSASTRTLPALGDPRFWLLLAGLIGIVATLFAPRIQLTRTARDVLLVVDITGSMNVRDYALDGEPVSRLATAKRAVRRLLTELPCQSRLGLSIFTERRMVSSTSICGAVR